ncbi:hypothetical protein BH23VER1_BH23VER1_05800 [soil metagenome]
MRILVSLILVLALPGCGSLPFFGGDRPLTPVERVGVGKKKHTGYLATVYRRGQSQGWSDGFDGKKRDYQAHSLLYSGHNEAEFKQGYKAGYKAGKAAARE